MTTHELHFGDLAVALETDTSQLMPVYGPRFDRTARVVAVRRGERSYLDSRGLTDEIGLRGLGVLGYEDAELGQAFAKIGVGALVRDDLGPYSFVRHYGVQSLFRVEILEASSRELAVRQVGWLNPEIGFRWEKTYRLESGSELSLTCKLANLGARSWAFEHYNHNFLSFDGVRVDSRYSVELGFAPSAEVSGGSRWRAEGGGLRLDGDAPEQGGVSWGGDLAGASAAENRVVVKHAHGGKVEFAGDFAPARFVLWAIRSTLCPEVFWRERLGSGEWARAMRSYRFD